MIHCLAFKYPWLQLPRVFGLLSLPLLFLLVSGLLCCTNKVLHVWKCSSQRKRSLGEVMSEAASMDFVWFD